MNKWTVIGSGPSGHLLDMPDVRGRKVIAVNMAALHIPAEWIDYYLMREMWTHERIWSLYGSGVKMVSLRAVPREIKDLFDKQGWPAWARDIQFLKAVPLSDKGWERGTYSSFRDPIGPQAVQLAVNKGASHVALWGMEGGFVEADGSIKDAQVASAEYQREILQAVVTACPDVTFEMHGKLLYSLEGVNVDTIPAAPPRKESKDGLSRTAR